MHHCDRSKTARRFEHGSGRLRPGRGPKEVHLRQGEHQLSLLQRGKLESLIDNVKFAITVSASTNQQTFLVSKHLVK